MAGRINSEYLKWTSFNHTHTNCYNPTEPIIWKSPQNPEKQRFRTARSTPESSSSSHSFTPIIDTTAGYATLSPSAKDITVSQSDISASFTKDTHNRGCHPYYEDSGYSNSDNSLSAKHSNITLVSSQSMKLKSLETSKDQETHSTTLDCSFAEVEQNNIRGKDRGNSSPSCSSNPMLGNYGTTKNNYGISIPKTGTIMKNDEEINRNNSERPQRPIVPRIVVPDGCSINLSTPPTTPRQQSRTFNYSQPSVWSHNLSQILERLGSRHIWNTGESSLDREISPQPWRYRTSRPNQYDLNRDSKACDKKGNCNPPTRDVYIGRSEDSLDETRPQCEVIGVPLHPYRPESLSSNDKDTWFEEEETPGTYFSRTRWNYLCCTTPGLIKMLKHSLTVIFGLFTIIAIGITASGKFRNRDRVSDYIPTNLTNAIMEAQVVVIKDFDMFQRSKMVYGQVQGTSDTSEHLISRRELAMNPQLGPRIPIWTGSVHTPCLHRRCDFEQFGEKYFAFLHAESFGISLDQNWPSLCNSCIEISINRFVYNTKVRVLGDLQSCPANPSESPTEPTISSKTTEMTTISPSPTRVFPNTKTASDSTVIATTVSKTAFHTSTAIKVGHETRVASSTTHKILLEFPKQPVSSQYSVLSSITTTKIPEPSNMISKEQAKTTKKSTYDDRKHIPEMSQSPSSVQGSMDNHKRSSPITQSGSSASNLPYLIVDPATFANLTVFEAQEELQNLDFLRVHFRFVLCDT